jgi:hypothetical protein
MPLICNSALNASSVEDFIGFGERYGIDYRFPQLTDADAITSPVLHGDVEEMTLSSGISLTHSDVRVYSRMKPPPVTVAPYICWWCWKGA